VTSFEECVFLVFERLGLGRPPAAYVADVVALNRAAAEWHETPEAQGLGFLEFDLPDLLAPGGVVLTGDLCNAIPQGWAKNKAAGAFLGFIDARTGYRCTLLQLQVVLLIQQAAQEGKVNAGGGQS
jgi:hypothetical protein